MRIILGSQSKMRQKVLKDAGYDFDVLSADIDERAIRHEDYYKLPLRIAQGKAAALLPKIEGPALLITADTVILLNGELREKARDENEARRFLETLDGSHPVECVTGVVVTNTGTGKSRSATDIAKVFISKLPASVVEGIIAEGGYQHWAGGFALQHPLIQPLVTRIEGTRESIYGLPMHAVEPFLLQLGYAK